MYLVNMYIIDRGSLPPMYQAYAGLGVGSEGDTCTDEENMIPAPTTFRREANSTQHIRAQCTECKHREGPHPSPWEEALHYGACSRTEGLPVRTLRGAMRKSPANVLKAMIDTCIFTV